MISLFFLMMFAGLFLGAFAIWIWCLVDAITGQFKNDSDKIIWIIILLVIPALGLILYLLIGRNNRL